MYSINTVLYVFPFILTWRCLLKVNVYLIQLQSLYPFLKIAKTDSDFHCQKCSAAYSIANSARSETILYLQTAKHKSADTAAASSASATLSKFSEIRISDLKNKNCQQRKRVLHFIQCSIINPFFTLNLLRSSLNHNMLVAE